MLVYIGTKENKIGVFQVDEDTGDLIRRVQVVDPVVESPHVPPPPRGMFSNIKAKAMAPVTDWILVHPKYDLMYAFTSFSSQQVAIVTTYQRNSEFGQLTKLGACSTGGLHATYATLSPDQSTLVVVHSNDGRLVFFDCMASGGVLEAPVKVVDTPEVNPDSRSVVFPRCLPSLQHCVYTPGGKFLLTVDSSKQSRIWTYPVDAHGIAITDKPSSNAKLLPLRPPPGALASFISSTVSESPIKLRRLAFHPNGRYLYVLYENHNVIQVYEITSKGRILVDCLQEIPCIDPAFFDQSPPPWKQTYAGIAINRAAELLSTEDGLWVSNRGIVAWGKADNHMRCYEYEDDGARLSVKYQLTPQGPVRHFAYLEQSDTANKIVTGMNNADPGVVETFVKNESEKFDKVGEATTGMDVLCLIAVPEAVRGV